MFYDAHNHLQDAWLTPHRDRVLADLEGIPLRRAVVNGTAEGDWSEVASLARQHTFVLPSFGLHPWNVGNARPDWRESLTACLDSFAVAGIGEIGLDRWILDRARPDDSRLTGLRRATMDEQVDAFVWQLALAAGRNLPVSIHCLEAWGALLHALRATPRPACGFLVHAFAGSIETARELAALGAYFSFNGYFLGERHAAKRAVFAALPPERLLVETDAPAMPLPPALSVYSLPGLADGNSINHPANIGAVYAGLASLLGRPLDELAVQVERNFLRLFGDA